MTSPGSRAHRPVSFLRRRAKVGLLRSRNSVWPALQITICSVSAYAFAQYVLGHEGPLFAATSSIIALGFSRDPRLRKVLEVAAGCTLGIAVGDTLLHILGVGLWQAAVVIFISILLARFLDSGSIFTTQLALQSLLVVLLPAPDGGPFTRSLDAVVGGTFALLITMLVPRDPRREPKVNLRELLDELAKVLRETAEAVTRSDSTRAWHALVRARNCQPMVDSLSSTLRSSREVATISPVSRRHRGEVERLEQALHSIDLAVRNSRVFSRRLASVINNAALTEEAMESLGALIDDTADGVRLLASALSETDTGSQESYLRQARNELEAVAVSLHPKLLSIQRLEGEGLVLLYRPMVVDLLEATGLDHDDARSYLPEL